MSEERDKLIAEAIRSLRLRDIMLHECAFERPSPPPLSDEINACQHSKRRVKFLVGDKLGDESKRIFQVFVHLGLRVTGAEGDATSPVYFDIEAEFLAEYELKEEISNEALKAFANFNSVHNVWPFWRQHVFDTVSRGKLPHLEVPLFGGSSKRKVEESTR